MRRFFLILITAIIVMVASILSTSIISDIIDNPTIKGGFASLSGFLNGFIGTSYVLTKWKQ